MYFDSIVNLLQASPWLQQQLPFTQESQALPEAFIWDEITPHKQFKWQSCFGDFQCARLQVPMDWLGDSAEADKSVELAVIKVKATVPVTDPTYGGAVVLNPGGPGGSGIDQVLKGGHFVRTVLSAGPGTDGKVAKNFDIIGFDPRGVNNTRPGLICFPDHIEAAAAAIEEMGHGMIDTSDTSFDNLWASKRAEAEGCSKRAADQGIGKHMSTASVARDIVEIFERHGEWREQEGRRLVEETVMSGEDRETALKRTAWKKDQEMVQYWGFSYGTILGATLSAIFPDRIHRAVLDGVADARDYMAGSWATNLVDTDMTFVKFAEYCYEGGRQNCAMWHEDGPAVIIENMQKTISHLKSNPLSIPAKDDGSPTAVTFNDLKLLIRNIVYWPILDFPRTARILYDLSVGNGSSLAIYKKDQRPSLAPLSERCLRAGPYSEACFEGTGDSRASYGIMCSDAPGDRLTQSKEEYRAYADRVISQSSLIGASWAGIQMHCTAWHARPHWRYEGDFHSQTAHPILFAGNTIDPVTPLVNAFIMGKGFNGAGILHQDSEGHCTYSGVSMCSMKAIRHYFQTGELPGKEGGLEDWEGMGALCETDRKPFDGYDVYSGKLPELPSGETDRALWEALLGLNRVWP